jgi:hypothetical protein
VAEWLAFSGGSSAHAVAHCLAHRKPVFLQGWGPDAGKWCHGTGWPCAEDPAQRCYCAGTGWITWPVSDAEPHPFDPAADDPAGRESCLALCDPAT